MMALRNWISSASISFTTSFQCSLMSMEREAYFVALVLWPSTSISIPVTKSYRVLACRVVFTLLHQSRSFLILIIIPLSFSSPELQKQDRSPSLFASGSLMFFLYFLTFLLQLSQVCYLCRFRHSTRTFFSQIRTSGVSFLLLDVFADFLNFCREAFDMA